MPKIVHLYTDGGSRNNPGPAGIGAVVKNEKGQILETRGEFVGVKTNNEAEYLALIKGLELAGKQQPQRVISYLDSQLVVKQLNGEYKIKEARLQELAIKVFTLIRGFREVELHHIPRRENEEADRLVNLAIDRRGSVNAL